MFARTHTVCPSGGRQKQCLSKSDSSRRGKWTRKVIENRNLYQLGACFQIQVKQELHDPSGAPKVDEKVVCFGM